MLGEAPPGPFVPTDDGPQLLVWSGVDERARAEVGDALLRLARTADDDYLPAIAYTSQVGRRPLRHRAALRVGGAPGRSSLSDPRAVVLGDGERRRPVFLFPGQGAQFPAMGREFAGWLPGFTTRVLEHLDAFDTLLGTSLTRIWTDEEDPVVLATTRHAQPLLFAVELACVGVLSELDVRPAAVLGHSVGELVAATVAGVFPEDDAIRVVAERARIMGDTPPGVLVAVAAPVPDVRTALTGDVWVSAVNGLGQTVVGGAEAEVAAFCRELDTRQVRYRRLPTAHAFQPQHGPGPGAES